MRMKPPQERTSLPSGLLHRSLAKDYPIAVRGLGVHLWDSHGRQYLDFSGSAAVNFIGHSSPAVADSIAQQAARLEFVHSSQFSTDVAEEFAQELLRFAGAAFKDGKV